MAALARLLDIRIRYNLMSRRPEIRIPGLKSERDDFETAAFAVLGDHVVRAGMSRQGLLELVNSVAGRDPYHPVGERIAAIEWDGRSRLDEFVQSLELADSSKAPLAKELLTAFMLQAVAACFESDGLAAQGMLVLSGGQGIGKTRWTESLVPLPGAVQTGTHLDPLDKDSVFQATASLVTELGELGSTTRRADIDALKAFLTRPADTLRRPYAPTENTYRRRTVFVGTVNGAGFLIDDTGNRRFWVISVSRCVPLAPDFAWQLWAELLTLYRGGRRWHLDPVTLAELNEDNQAYQTTDPLRERIVTAFDWAQADSEDWHKRGRCSWLTATEICTRVGVTSPTRSEATRAGAIVSELNQRASRKSSGAKLLAVPIGPHRIGLDQGQP